jgi:hypothetical protein
MERETRIIEPEVGRAAVLRRGAFAGATVDVLEADVHGAITARLRNPIVVEPEDYELLDA